MALADSSTPVRIDAIDTVGRNRLPYVAPILREYGTLSALTKTRTCAKSYNDGTSVGCSNSAKKS